MRSGLRLVSWVLALAVAVSAAYAADRPSTERRGPAPGHDASTRHELMGRVVRSGANVVYLEHMGAVVAFRITRGTQFTGLGAKASGDLVEGQQVLATFTVQDGVTNVARRIAATSEATGEPPRERMRTPPAPR
jgi:hypothetical protein